MPAHRTTRESSAAALVKSVEEAQFNVAYYRRQAVIRTHPDGIAEAKGLAAVWASTLAARMAAFTQAKPR